MGPIWGPYISNIGLSGQPLADPRKYRLHSHSGTQMPATDKPHLGAHIGRTWAPPENVTWVIIIIILSQTLGDEDYIL